jgi:acyl dehydratase
MGAPGVEEVRWLAPVRAGQPFMARATVLETRPSRSRPEMGFVRFLFELVAPDGTKLMALTVNPIFGRRTAPTTAREPPLARS